MPLLLSPSALCQPAGSVHALPPPWISQQTSRFPAVDATPRVGVIDIAEPVASGDICTDVVVTAYLGEYSARNAARRDGPPSAAATPAAVLRALSSTAPISSPSSPAM